MPTRLLFLALLALGLVGCDTLQDDAATTLGVQYAVEATDDAPARVTFDDGSGAQTLEITEAWSYRFSADDDASLSLRAEHLQNGEVIVRVAIDDRLTSERRGRVVAWFYDDSDDDDRFEIEREGPITAKQGDRVTIGDVTFVVTAQTRILDDDDNPITYEDFTVGTYAEADGYRLADGTVRAKKLEFDDPDDRDDGMEVEREGPIVAKDGNRLIVRSLTFVVTAQTRFLDDDDNPISYDAFTVGTYVEAEGSRQSDGTVRAEKLKLEDEGDDDDDGDGTEIEREGPIMAKQGDQVVVRGIAFVVTEETRLLDDDGNPVPYSAFTVGTYVEAEGYRQADGTVRAEKLELEDEGDDDDDDDDGD